MALPKNIIDDFEKVTSFPLKDFFEKYLAVVNNHRRNIVNYYAGAAAKPNERSFAALRKILKEMKSLNAIIELHNNRMRHAAYWELLEVISTVDTALQTLDNSSRWLRSAITKNNFNPNLETNYTLRKLQTLEQVSGNVLGSTDRDRDWVKLALRNQLPEEAYTPDGGNTLVVSGEGSKVIQLRSVVDNISGEKVYGLDIDRKLTYVNDDLKVLSYKETIVQTVEILSTMTQGRSPEFPGNGIEGSLARGSNLNSVAYPILIRQMYQTFSQDDTLKTLKITKLDTSQDSLSIELEVETRLGDVLNQSVTI